MKDLISIYKQLYRYFGPRKWWPADTPFEVMIGAILTQNANWMNVERAISNLKKKNILSPSAIADIPFNKLAPLVRPSGFYKQKTKRLKEFSRFLLVFCKGDIKKLRRFKTDTIRRKLLAIKGIGPETADSILLYALNKPVFVVDAYTRRIFSRHGFIRKDAPYGDIQNFFIEKLPVSTKLFNEYHALIVEVGKQFCNKKNPKCSVCPLKDLKRGRGHIQI